MQKMISAKNEPSMFVVSCLKKKKKKNDVGKGKTIEGAERHYLENV